MTDVILVGLLIVAIVVAVSVSRFRQAAIAVAATAAAFLGAREFARRLRGEPKPDPPADAEPEPVDNPATPITNEVDDVADEIDSMPDSDLADAWADHADRAGTSDLPDD